jgi:hypothetical protein
MLGLIVLAIWIILGTDLYLDSLWLVCFKWYGPVSFGRFLVQLKLIISRVFMLCIASYGLDFVLYFSLINFTCMHVLDVVKKPFSAITLLEY